MNEHEIHFNLAPLLGTQVVVETTEGSRLVGKLTKIHYSTNRIMGKDVRVPFRVELNNDPSEFMDWPLIKEILKAS